MAFIFENMRPGNALQPMQEQTNKLLLYKIENNINTYKMSSLEWLKAFDHSLLFDDCIEKVQDQKYRAKILVDYLLKCGLKTSVLFDGHGRMLYCILCDIKSRGLDVNEYFFYFYEIDEETHNWHNEYFPLKNCCNILENIFNAEHQFSNCLYYLNFCGIGGCQTDVYDFIKQRFEENKENAPVMLSCSRRSTNPRKNKTKTLLWNINRNFNMDKVCYLKLFDTYLILPST
jgi:hypothetical protein